MSALPWPRLLTTDEYCYLLECVHKFNNQDAAAFTIQSLEEIIRADARLPPYEQCRLVIPNDEQNTDQDTYYDGVDGLSEFSDRCPLNHGDQLALLRMVHTTLLVYPIIHSEDTDEMDSTDNTPSTVEEPWLTSLKEQYGKMAPMLSWPPFEEVLPAIHDLIGGLIQDDFAHPAHAICDEPDYEPPSEDTIKAREILAQCFRNGGEFWYQTAKHDPYAIKVWEDKDHTKEFTSVLVAAGAYEDRSGWAVSKMSRKELKSFPDGGVELQFNLAINHAHISFQKIKPHRINSPKSR